MYITLVYPDGSLAHIAYLSNGSKAYTAERAEIFCDNRVATLRDFRILEMTRGLSVKTERLWMQSDKGHAGQINAYLNAVSGRGQALDIQSYIESSRAAIKAALAT